jgi:hypothetical protein
MILAGAASNCACSRVSSGPEWDELKAHDLITSPAFILLKAADHFVQPTSAPNQLWQTDRRRCLRHSRDGAAQFRFGPRPRPAPAAPAEQQWDVVRVGPTRLLARGARHDPYPRQALSPDDPGQDRTLPPFDEEPDPAREITTCPVNSKRACSSSSITTTPGVTTKVSTT